MIAGPHSCPLARSSISVPGCLWCACLGLVIAFYSFSLHAQNTEEAPQFEAQQVRSFQVILLERVENLHRELQAFRGRNEVLRAELTALRSQLESLEKTVAELPDTKHFSVQLSSPHHVVLPGSVGRSGELGNAVPDMVPASTRRKTGTARLVVDSSPRALSARWSPDLLPGATQGGAGSDGSDDRDYYLALAPLKSGDFAVMRHRLQEYVDTHRSGVYLASAWYWIGESWYEQGDYKEARQIFEQFLQDYPQHERYHDVRFKLAEIYRAQGQMRQARMFLEALSGVADERISTVARQRLKTLGDVQQ